MGDFFGASGDGRVGLALFLNAGDPPLAVLPDLVSMLDDCGVDCLELAVPFPDSVTDGPVIRRSAQRALAAGVGLDEALHCVRGVRRELRHLRIALLADWSHTVRPGTLRDFVGRVADSGADGLLLHALPPRLRFQYYQDAIDVGLPIVTTCYPGSDPARMVEAAACGSAYVYLVAHYGRSGSAPANGYGALATTISALRATAGVPIAVGFGIRTGADVAMVHDLGADAAVVGTAGVACVERAHTQGRDVVEDVYHFVCALRTRAPLDGSPLDRTPRHRPAAYQPASGGHQ